MSGMSRSSVSSLPKTGTITSTSLAAGTNTTVAGPAANSGATWKVIGISVTPAGLELGSGNFNLINTANANKIVLTAVAGFSGSDQVPVDIGKYVAGELLLDENIRIEFANAGDAAMTCQVAYVVVN